MSMQDVLLTISSKRVSAPLWLFRPAGLLGRRDAAAGDVALLGGGGEVSAGRFGMISGVQGGLVWTGGDSESGGDVLVAADKEKHGV